MINILLCQKTKITNELFYWFRNTFSAEQTEDISPSNNNRQIKVNMKVEMEMLLWKFIDGECTSEEEKEVKSLILTNSEWQEEYEELMKMHNDFQVLIPLRKNEFSK